MEDISKELPYWMALAHLPKINNRLKNEIIIRIHEEEKTIVDFFHSSVSDWNTNYNLTDKETDILQEAMKDIPNYAFLAEDLTDQGYAIIPLTSPQYSSILKKNLGRTYAPQIIYIKGNVQILEEESVAIVGSRKASDVSLAFTDTIAKKATEEFKVVVSGYAKGVDRQALESAIAHKGRSIIVLPQGIMTFNSGYKAYYKQIIEGDVMVLSTFYPKAPWNVQLAMARNPLIYGLANEIFVAESSEKGGTWSGVMDGLKKGRLVYVRQAQQEEKNANNILISKGAKPVDQEGNLIEENH